MERAPPGLTAAASGSEGDNPYPLAAWGRGGEDSSRPQERGRGGEVSERPQAREGGGAGKGGGRPTSGQERNPPPLPETTGMEYEGAAGIATSAEATASAWDAGEVERGAQREFVNARVLLSWDACVKKERPRIVAAASVVEFERAASLVLPPGQEWVHLDRPDGLKASGRAPKDSRMSSTKDSRMSSTTCPVDALEAANAVTLDMTHLGNDLLIDTLAVVTRIASVHLDTLQVMVVKSRAVSELAMKLLPAKRALERGAALFDDRSFRPAVICSTGVLEYRATIQIVVRPGDSVLEIGCHSGTTTRLMQEVAGLGGMTVGVNIGASIEAAGPGGRAVGVDIGASIVRQAAAAYPDVEFAVADAWDSHALVTLAGDRP
ncbi:hypothetical protein T484DRAFT_1797476, partial [Baffinella frigidus]